jgi:hypothetical protein
MTSKDKKLGANSDLQLWKLDMVSSLRISTSAFSVSMKAKENPSSIRMFGMLMPSPSAGRSPSRGPLSNISVDLDW